MKGSQKFILPALCLIFLAGACLSLSAQEPKPPEAKPNPTVQEQKQPQAKTQVEYDAYMAAYKEQAPAAKAEFASTIAAAEGMILEIPAARPKTRKPPRKKTRRRKH